MNIDSNLLNQVIYNLMIGHKIDLEICEFFTNGINYPLASSTKSLIYIEHKSKIDIWQKEVFFSINSAT